MDIYIIKVAKKARSPQNNSNQPSDILNPKDQLEQDENIAWLDQNPSLHNANMAFMGHRRSRRAARRRLLGFTRRASSYSKRRRRVKRMS